MLSNRAIVTITGRSSRLSGSVKLYQGVVELAGPGFTFVEIALSYGAKEFPSIPYMITVDCESTICEMRKGKWPLLTVAEWEPMTHFYM